MAAKKKRKSPLSKGRPRSIEDFRLNDRGRELVRYFQEHEGASAEEAVRWAKAACRRTLPECKDYKGKP